MKISILIPAFHADPFISDALESVRAQTHPDWELIVVEDGSHDGTAEILERFRASSLQRVIYDNLGENMGVGTVRNRLLELASGDALAFLDADDSWAPSHLANAVALLGNGADLVVSGVRTFDLVRKRELEKVPAPPALVDDPIRTLFEHSAIITSSSVIVRQSLAERTGTFDTSLRIGEDRDYWLRCALAGGQFAVTRDFTCNYAKHLSSSMARTYVVAQHVTRFYEKYRGLSAVPARRRRQLLADSLVCLGRLLREHDRNRSAACLWRAWRYQPLDLRIPFHLAFTGWRSVYHRPQQHAA